MSRRIVQLPVPIADEDAVLDHRPDRKTKTYHYKRYAGAFAKGIMRAIGTSFAEPEVRGPTDPMVRLCNAHAEGRRGDELLEWIEETSLAFKQNAPENEVKYHGGWSPKGMLWWLDNGKPTATITRQVGVASIGVRKV